MKDDAMKFLFKRTVVIGCVLPNSVNTNINFGVYRLTLFGKVKGDDVGKEVMMKVLPVHGQQVGIRAEDVLERGQGLTLLFYHFANKLL